MGERGPIPKRSTQRRRRNSDGRPDTAPAARKVPVPAASKEWHPAAKRWYQSLRRSGQAEWYEPSDWATAWVVAESMSRELQPQVVGVTDEGEPVRAAVPMRGASLSAYLRAMANLLVTEGDRRRMRVELERPEPDDGEDGEDDAEVARLDAYRRRVSG